MKKKTKRNCFEGWYFREQSESFTCAFIPEISYDEEGEMTGSLQVVLPDRTLFLAYPHPVNMNLPGSLFLVLGKNVFTDACIHLDIDEADFRIKGDIYFDYELGAKFHVMGPLQILPLPCKHRIYAMEQVLSGTITVNEKTFSFEGGKGYLEADYGRSFPKTYFWSHCNWFSEKALRITCAAAEIPLGAGGGKPFLGCFACIDQGGYKVKLASYKGARIEHFSADGFRIRQGRYTFEGWKMEGKPVVLQSPDSGIMKDSTEEYLECTVRYRLCRGDEVLFDEISQRAAYEFR